jgi:copper chaperone NosL
MKTMFRSVKFMVLIFLVIPLAACSVPVTYPAQAIDSSTDVCAKCNMHISDDQFAVEYITDDGTCEKFDDLGCMIKYINSNNVKPAKIYVRDYISKAWIDGTTASYVYNPSIHTPMSNGVVSFKTIEEVQNFISENGKGEFMDYNKLLDFFGPNPT